LISKPGHYFTVGSTYAQGDSEEKQVDLEGSGDFGSRFPLTYWFYSRYYRDNGYLENSEVKSAGVELVLGYKPNYKHDIFLDLGYNKNKIGVPRVASNWAWFLPSFLWPWGPDNDQEYKDNSYWIELGYHRRFSPISHLLTDLRYLKCNDNLENPSFERDLSGFADSRGKTQNIAFGIRHMLTLRTDHQFSYGMDYNFVKLNLSEKWPYISSIWAERIKSSLIRRSLIFHIYDRWTIIPKITLDAGLFFSYYSPEEEFHFRDNILGPFDSKIDENKFNLNPRVGLTIALGNKGVFRIAYQRRSTTGFLGELAPVGASGLIPPTFDIFFNAAQDLQGSIEYELTKKTFIKALLGYERLSDLTTTSGDKRAQLWYSRIAINQILGRHFSLSARYHYNDSKFLDGSGRELYGIPRNSGDARLVFVHPRQIYLWLREAYIGERFADSANTIKLKGYFSTDFFVQKEILKKKVLLSFAINNIFNAKYETLNHPYWWYSGALPAKGTTFSFRIEYRL